MNFAISQIPEDVSQNMINKNIWQNTCPVPLARLRLLNLIYFDFAKEMQSGQIIVLDKVANNVINIFQKLFNIRFPINKIKLINEYNGDDKLSMSDNNSSSFNYRQIANSSLISMHSYGLAIDINPLQNPCLDIDEKNQTMQVLPKAGVMFLNRNKQREGMIEPVVEIFKAHGFDSWGGEWDNPIDYHHFQIDRKNLSQFI